MAGAMEWQHLFSQDRFGVETPTSGGPRTEFQRDFDRIVFSSGFRRLQNKTQVFPLPGATFVHNRLTHSLEVASVGRSLGKIVGGRISDTVKGDEAAVEFYKYELQNVIASACLAHDIGNPAYGHSGEKAISNYFEESAAFKIDGQPLKKFFKKAEWKDLCFFEGNANAIRVLTHEFNGKSKGGYKLTYATLGALLKYPCESTGMDDKKLHKKKYGFFQGEKETALAIVKNLNMLKESDKPLSYKRHPFVFLTEAADDICYRIMDLEDAQRLGILDHKQVADYFLNLIEQIHRPEEEIDRVNKGFKNIGDINEGISYLRGKCINVLALKSADLFIEHSKELLEGSLERDLVAMIAEESTILKKIEKLSYNEIYNHDTVMEIEIAGYNVMFNLLSLFIPAALKENPTHKDEKVCRLIPAQFQTPLQKITPYDRVFQVLDYISGMTDPYATELYRKTYGIDTPKHR